MQVILIQGEIVYYVFDFVEESILSFGFGWPVYWILQKKIRTRETFHEFMQRQMQLLKELYELQEGEDVEE